MFGGIIMALRITNKTRFFTRVGILLMIVILLLAYSLHQKLQESRFEDTLTFSIEVVPGDTLWAIAERYHEDMEVRDFLYDLRVLNSINPDGTIYAGQTLEIPLMTDDLQMAEGL